jgi:hypothetical protein
MLVLQDAANSFGPIQQNCKQMIFRPNKFYAMTVLNNTYAHRAIDIITPGDQDALR